MATPKSLSSLDKSKEAVSLIRKRILPVLQRLADDGFGEATDRAQASVALSIGMMRYMGARLRGLDQGRRPDDPLRKDLNNIKRVLAMTKKSSSLVTSESKPDTNKSKTPTGKLGAVPQESRSLNCQQYDTATISKRNSGCKKQHFKEASTTEKKYIHKKKMKTKFVMDKHQSASKKSRSKK